MHGSGAENVNKHLVTMFWGILPSKPVSHALYHQGCMKQRLLERKCPLRTRGEIVMTKATSPWIAKLLAIGSIAVAGLMAGTAAQAHGGVSLSIGLGAPVYGNPYVAPAPVYMPPRPVSYPPPPPVYYAPPPRPVYYNAPPVYYTPPPAVYYGGYGNGHRHRHHGHGHGHGHGRHWDR